MFTVLQGGDLYCPEHIGKADILLLAGKIARIGEIDVRSLELSQVKVDVIDATDCLVIPGLIDPHEHLLGGSGEEGFQTQTPEIALREIVAGGITTVVGCLGTDTTTKTMPGLLAKAKAFNLEGLTAYIYSGGYNVPPVTLTGSIRQDMLYIPEVIGAGEIAVSDARSTEPTSPELARLVRDAYVGGLLTGKCGVTHFHIGSGTKRLKPLRALLNDYEIDPELLYPTHVERNEQLMIEAIELSRRGVTVDVDTVERDLSNWIRFFLDNGGDPAHFTVSSDAAINSPTTLFQQIRSCILDDGLPFDLLLPMVTANTARKLKLVGKGRLAEGADADAVMLRRGSLEIAHVIAGGRHLIKNGGRNFSESFLKSSNREIELYGDKR
jgi:beta-aspartyl-dipeptidase (metallo-type)